MTYANIGDRNEFKALSYYDMNFFSREHIDALTRELPEKQARQEARFAALREEIVRISNLKYYLAQLFEKRCGIVERLIAYIHRTAEGNEPDARLHAWQAFHELKQLLDYFDEAIAIYKEDLVAKPVTWSVKDFGAQGDGYTDDANAIRQAIAKAKKYDGRVTLIMPKGRYVIGSVETSTIPITNRLSPDQQLDAQKTGHILLVNLDGFTLQGEPGTMLILKDPSHEGVLMLGCRNTTVRNLAIDYDPLPFTQGTITAVDQAANSFTWKIDTGYPTPLGERFLPGEKRKQPENYRGTVHFAETGRINTEPGDKFLRNIEAVSANEFKVNVAYSWPPQKGPLLRAGTRPEIRHSSSLVRCRGKRRVLNFLHF